MPNPTVFAIDVGRIDRIGWYVIGPTGERGGESIDDLADELVAALDRGEQVALGLEAPMFVPVPSTPAQIGRQRDGENGRPWSVGAGATVLAFGLQECAYLLCAVAERGAVRPRVGFDPTGLHDGSIDLLVWEAFVSGKAKPPKGSVIPLPHQEDARAAATAFIARWAGGTIGSDVSCPRPLNLAAASLIASGLSDDPRLLTAPCLVVKAADWVPVA